MYFRTKVRKYFRKYCTCTVRVRFFRKYCTCTCTPVAKDVRTKGLNRNGRVQPACHVLPQSSVEVRFAKYLRSKKCRDTRISRMKAASRAGAYTTSPFFCTSRHRSRLPTTRDVPCRTRVVPVARSNLTLDRRSPSNMRNSLFYTAGSRNFWLQERRCGATSWTSVSNKLPLLLAAADFTGKSHDYKKETSRCKKKISVKNDYVTKGSSEHKTLGIVSKASVCTGMLARIPVVCPSVDILNSGIKRASRMTPTKGLKDATLKERNRCSKQIDALTTSLCKPLGEYVKFFPRLQRLHPFERALLELTLRDEHYETTLHQVNLLRKGLLSIGKQSAARAAQARGPKEATNIRQKCFDELKCYFNQHGHHVDNLKEIAKALRRLPVAELRTPTMALVGAPNVGKSSIVRVLSSGTPHVCNYPFTTRAIKMGHFFIDSERYTITDTPGLLWRPV